MGGDPRRGVMETRCVAAVGSRPEKAGNSTWSEDLGGKWRVKDSASGRTKAEFSQDSASSSKGGVAKRLRLRVSKGGFFSRLRQEKRLGTAVESLKKTRGGGQTMRERRSLSRDIKKVVRKG